MKKILWLPSVVFLCCASFSAGANATQLTPDQKKVLELKPAIVIVQVSFTTTWKIDVNGKTITVNEPVNEIGTGFIYRPDGYIITNGHVVADAHLKDADALDALKKRLKAEYQEAIDHAKISDQQKGVLKDSPYNISISTPTLLVFLANGQRNNAEVLQWDPEIGTGKDVAILKIPGNDLPTVPLSDSTKVRVQDPIMVIGYPGVASNWGNNDLISNQSNFEPSATNGHISAIKMTNIQTPVFQSDAAITHGNSGGPVFNEQGEVIGIATFGTEGTQGFNFFVPINTAMEFVRQTGVLPAAGAFNKNWADALDLYDNGKCAEAIPQFDNVLQFMPNLPDARQFRLSAVKCWNDMNGFQRMMETSGWMVYSVIGIAILALGGLLLRNRTVVPTPAGAGAAAVQAPLPPVTPVQALPVAAPAATSYGSIQATAGPLSGKTFKISKEGLLIGRSPKCQVMLQDDTISSEHAWIVPADGSVVLIDRGSSNGTYINSVDSPRVSKVGLKNGDRIYLGKKGTATFTYFG